MSKYIRLRDALTYCKEMRIDTGQFNNWQDLPCACCTCGKILTVREADCGHFISRGSGGQSGVYFDERNCHFQCRSCNRFNQGRTLEYNDFMLEKYGQEVVDELRKKDKVLIRKRSVMVLAFYKYYKEAYQKLLDSI